MARMLEGPWDQIRMVPRAATRFGAAGAFRGLPIARNVIPGPMILYRRFPGRLIERDRRYGKGVLRVRKPEDRPRLTWA